MQHAERQQDAWLHAAPAPHRFLQRLARLVDAAQLLEREGQVVKDGRLGQP